MKIAPIISTRTFNCDYNLVVKPSDFSNNDIKDIEKYILASSNSRSINYLKGERWIVIDKGDYRIAGIVGFLKNICENCTSLSEKQKIKCEHLFRDCADRLIYSFIGIVINKRKNAFEKFTPINSSEEYIEPTYDYFWKLFVDNIEPIWNNLERTNILKEFSNIEYNANDIIEEKNPVQNVQFVSDFKSFENKKVYISDYDRDYELFKYYLNSKDNNFSFCSNFSKFDNISTSIFSIITSNNIGQIENNKKIKVAKENIGEIKEVTEEHTKKEIEAKINEDVYIENGINFFKTLWVILLGKNDTKIISLFKKLFFCFLAGLLGFVSLNFLNKDKKSKKKNENKDDKKECDLIENYSNNQYENI